MLCPLLTSSQQETNTPLHRARCDKSRWQHKLRPFRPPPSHTPDLMPPLRAEAKIERVVKSVSTPLCGWTLPVFFFCLTWTSLLYAMNTVKYTAFSPTLRLLFLLPVKLTFWIACVTLFRDTKLSSDSADKEAFYARRESAAQSGADSWYLIFNPPLRHWYLCSG